MPRKKPPRHIPAAPAKPHLAPTLSSRHPIKTPPSAAPNIPADPPRAYPVAVTPPPATPVLGPLKALASAGPGKTSVAGPKSGVAVVGSLNMDLVVRAEIMPLPGQTVTGQDLLQNPGGKGGNQAAAVGRLWHRRAPGSKLIARIGDDVFGQNVLAALQAARVDTGSVLTTRHTPTGTAMILVDRHGEHAMVVAGGANRHLSATDLLAQRKTIETSVVLLAQLETPGDTVACAFALAKRSNVLTILDPSPAPAEGLPESLHHVDILTPNQGEAQLLTGMQVRTIDDARRAAERFLLRGTRIVVIKMGSQGAVIVYKEERAAGPAGHAGPAAAGYGGAMGPKIGAPAAAGAGTVAIHIPGFRVSVVDTTGAGDAFAGALAVALAEGTPLPQAVRFANAAGALACTKAGAMAAMPARAEVDKLVAGT